MTHRLYCNCTSIELRDGDKIEAPQNWLVASNLPGHYRCDVCEHDVQMQSISDDNPIDQPSRYESIETINQQLQAIDEPYTTDQVAVILGYKSGNSVRKLIERNRLRSVKRGNMNLLYKQDVLDFVATHGVYKCQNHSHQSNGNKPSKST